MLKIAPGAMLGRYRIERILGKGGMGVACLATDTLLGAPVVVKTLSLAITFHSEALERFKRELLLARRVAHPGVCRVFDIHCEGEQWFLTMEHVEGTTLEDLVRKAGLLSVERVGSIVEGICLAVAAAHQEGILHRDLKPSNVMVRPGDEVSVLDFGLATAVDVERLTRSGMWVGTPSYLAPEVAKGERATTRSDVYSLGVILYRCLAGRVPFAGANVVDVCDAVVRGQFVPASKFNPRVTPQLDGLIAAAMKSDPAQRPASAVKLAEFIAAATRQLNGRSVEEQLAPWNGDIDSSVEQLMQELTYSQVLAQQMAQVTVLFSDIVGITPFFDVYGDIAGRKRIRAHNELLFPVITSLRGRVIKTIGDAIMAVFPDAGDGVAAAIAMQRALTERNALQASERDRLFVRIGLHTGEAIVERHDVFGDTVNVAARVSAKADGEQILVSEPTRALLTDHVRTHLFTQTTLKGKSGTFRLYAVDWTEADATAPPAGRAPAASAAAMPDETPRDAGPVVGLHAAPTPEAQDPALVTAIMSRRNAAPAPTTRLSRSRGRHRGLAYSAGATALVIATALGWAARQDAEKRQRARGDLASPALVSPLPAATLAPSVTPVPAGGLATAGAPAPAGALATAGALAPTAATASLAADVLAARRAVEQHMTQLGVIRGDVTGLDRTLEQLGGLIKRGELEAALAAAKKAQRQLEQVHVNEPFVLGKLARFNGVFDRVTDPVTAAALTRESQVVMAALQEKDYDLANRHLNRGFELSR